MITVRMPEDRVARIDALVQSESYESRASFIVEAIDRLVRELEEREIDRAIVEGYTRFPQTEEDLRWAEASARRLDSRGALVNAGRGVVGRATRRRDDGRTSCSRVMRRFPVLRNVSPSRPRRTVRGIATEVALGPEDGMPDRSASSRSTT